MSNINDIAIDAIDKETRCFQEENNQPCLLMLKYHYEMLDKRVVSIKAMNKESDWHINYLNSELKSKDSVIVKPKD